MKRKVVRVVFLSVAGIIISLTLVGFIFQDKIINLALQNFRKDIRSRITIGDAQFSLIKDFPYASIRLYDVSILSTKDIKRTEFLRYVQPDTLLKAKSLNLKLNILNLISDKIAIRQITAQSAELKLLIDKEGNNNFAIIKKTPSGTAKVTLNINSIRLENSTLQLFDLSKQLAVINTIEYLKTDGNFNLERFKTKTKAKILVNQLAIGSINYIHNKPFELNGNIKSTSYKSFDFNDFDLIYKNNKIKIDGGFSLNKATYLNISAVGLDLALKDMNDLIPKVNKTLEKINLEGKASLSAKAEGYWTKKQKPFLYGNFDVRGGKSEILNNNSIASVNLLGEFSNGKGNISNAFIRVKSYKITSNFGDFEGKFTLTNFNRPLISLSSNFNLFLEKLNKAYHIDSTNTLDGALIGNITADGNVNFDSLSPLKLIRLVNNGSFKLSEMKIPCKEGFYYIQNGEITFNPNIAKAQLRFKSKNINGNVKAIVNNFYDGVMDSKPLSVSLEGNMENIDFDKILISLYQPKHASSTAQRDINLVNINLDISSKNASIRNIPIANLRARIDKLGSVIDILNLNGEAFEGKINISGKLEQLSTKTISSSLLLNIENVNINNLFYSFNNFDQKTITSSNIKGNANGEIAFKGQFASTGKLLPSTVECVADISITNGELIKFEPAYKLSRFIDLSELENIKFSSLKNRITIKNSVITIPAMYVGSSAINLGIIGNHNFNGDYSYRIRLALKDFLFNKARKGLKKQINQSEFENNMLLYFRVEGNANTSKISYDWNGKNWDLPPTPSASSPSLNQNTPEKSKENLSSKKKFGVEWEGDTVTQKKVITDINKEKKNKAEKKQKEETFKVVWEE